MDYLERMLLLDAVDYLHDRVDELRLEDEITADTFNRKKAFRGLIRVVNRADRQLAAVDKQKQIFALFVPKDLKVIPLGLHGVFAGDYIMSITDSDLSAVHPTAIQVFLNKEPWHEITSIVNTIAVYAENPVVNDTAAEQLGTGLVRGNKLEPSLASDFYNSTAPGRFWFDTKNRMLYLSNVLEEDSFLVFEAQSVPSLIDVREFEVNSRNDAENTVLADYLLDTNLLHEGLLLDLALSILLPTKFSSVSNELISGRMNDVEAGNGPVVVEVMPEWRY